MADNAANGSKCDSAAFVINTGLNFTQTRLNVTLLSLLAVVIRRQHSVCDSSVESVTLLLQKQLAVHLKGSTLHELLARGFSFTWTARVKNSPAPEASFLTLKSIV